MDKERYQAQMAENIAPLVSPTYSYASLRTLMSAHRETPQIGDCYASDSNNWSVAL